VILSITISHLHGSNFVIIVQRARRNGSHLNNLCIFSDACALSRERMAMQATQLQGKHTYRECMHVACSPCNYKSPDKRGIAPPPPHSLFNYQGKYLIYLPCICALIARATSNLPSLRPHYFSVFIQFLIVIHGHLTYNTRMQIREIQREARANDI
jgi:hypothetical protein